MLRAGTIRVASYNVRKGVGTDRRRDPARTLEIVSRLGAQVVALQEADHRLAPRPAALPPEAIAARTGLVPLRPPGAGPSLGHHGNALLVAPALRPLRVEPLSLPHLEPRGALLAELALPDGQALRVIAVHLGLLRRWRREQLEHIARLLAARDPMPAVVMGDFNEWREGPGVLPLPRGWHCVAPGASFHARVPVATLDRILVSPGIRVRHAGVHDEPEARRASDHLPVWAEIELTAVAQAHASGAAARIVAG